MSRPNGTPSAIDENVLLAEALHCALGHADGPTSLNEPALAELPELIVLARRVEASAHAVEPSAEFRAAARMRLVASMRYGAASSASHVRQPQRPPWRLRLVVPGWIARAAAVLSTVALAGAATASASASALPGDPLYAIKAIAEHVALETASNSAARRQLLLRQADTRLDETSRLLEQGRDAEAGQNAARYGDALDAAAGAPGAAEPVETGVQADRTRLTSLLAKAPPPAQAGLQHALQAAERRLARVPRTPQSEVDEPTPKARPALVQPASDVRLEATPAPTTTPSSMTAGPGAGGEAATPESAGGSADDVQHHAPAEPHVAQSRHDAAPATVERGHATGGAARPVGPPERPAQPAPGVDKPRGAPVTPVEPARRGRP